VNDLLDYFQIKNGKFKKNLQWVNVKQSFNELVDMFGVGAAEKGVELVFEVDEQSVPGELLVDEQRLKQVALNLLQNALKFTYEGHIRLALAYLRDSKEL
jgi:signal transduction histidine kinase